MLPIKDHPALIELVDYRNIPNHLIGPVFPHNSLPAARLLTHEFGLLDLERPTEEELLTKVKACKSAKDVWHRAIAHLATIPGDVSKEAECYLMVLPWNTNLHGFRARTTSISLTTFLGNSWLSTSSLQAMNEMLTIENHKTGQLPDNYFLPDIMLSQSILKHHRLCTQGSEEYVSSSTTRWIRLIGESLVERRVVAGLMNLRENHWIGWGWRQKG